MSDTASLCSLSSELSNKVTELEVLSVTRKDHCEPDLIPDSPKLRELLGLLSKEFTDEDVREILKRQNFFAPPDTYADAATTCYTGGLLDPAFPGIVEPNIDSYAYARAGASTSRDPPAELNLEPAGLSDVESVHGESPTDVVNAGASTSRDTNAGQNAPASKTANLPTSVDDTKIYKPGECLKYMVIEMHPDLANAWFMKETAIKMKENRISIVMNQDIGDHGLVLWCRISNQLLVQWQGRAQMAVGKECGGRGAWVVTATQASHMVLARGLTRHVARQAARADVHLTLVVLGAKEFFRTRGPATNATNRFMNEADLENAVVALLCENIDTQFVETPDELANFMLQFTKSVADAPFKRERMKCDDQVDFYMKGDNKNCVRVNKNGNGLKRLWEQMIAVLPMSSLDKAKALCNEFASPRELYEALHSPAGVQRVAALGVAHAAAPGALRRRAGGEFANKLSVLLTAADGHLLVHSPGAHAH